jgi:hemoglobin-like flavoprotein
MAETTLVTADKIALIEDSFEKIAIHSEAFVKQFYSNLFALYPHFEPLFTTNRDEQERKLFKTLMIMTQNLRRPSLLHSHFQPLGERHAGQYGVSLEYYSQFIGVLIHTMREFAGAEWTPELEQAWQEGLDVLVDMMAKPIPAN